MAYKKEPEHELLYQYMNILKYDPNKDNKSKKLKFYPDPPFCEG